MAHRMRTLVRRSTSIWGSGCKRPGQLHFSSDRITSHPRPTNHDCIQTPQLSCNLYKLHTVTSRIHHCWWVVSFCCIFGAVNDWLLHDVVMFCLCHLCELAEAWHSQWGTSTALLWLPIIQAACMWCLMLVCVLDSCNSPIYYNWGVEWIE